MGTFAKLAQLKMSEAVQTLEGKGNLPAIPPAC
jgi:hypothetical protein